MNLQELHQQHRDAQARLDELRPDREQKNADLDARIRAVRDQWERENAEFLEVYDEILKASAIAEATLREAIKAAYAADPSKKTVAPGLSVRLTRKPKYDAETAFQWALDHKLALALDKKAFEIYAANDTQSITFVEYEETVSAVIGK